ncbi:hypothetical protein PENTCL1PPCAC_11629, partial [Pristionchus entomophagus]
NGGSSRLWGASSLSSSLSSEWRQWNSYLLFIHCWNRSRRGGGRAISLSPQGTEGIQLGPAWSQDSSLSDWNGSVHSWFLLDWRIGRRGRFCRWRTVVCQSWIYPLSQYIPWLV